MNFNYVILSLFCCILALGIYAVMKNIDNNNDKFGF